MRRATAVCARAAALLATASAPSSWRGAARRRSKHSPRRFGRVRPDLALPQPHNGPPSTLSQAGRMPVALSRPGDLCLPQASVRAPEAPPPVCWAAVPEVTVDENSHAAAWEHQVRGTAVGKLTVEAEPCAGSVEGTSQEQLRFGVLAAASTKALTRRGRHPLLHHETQSSTDSAALPISPGSGARVPPPDAEREGPLARSPSSGYLQPRRRHRQRRSWLHCRGVGRHRSVSAVI